jgi:hypothetical protein
VQLVKRFERPTMLLAYNRTGCNTSKPEQGYGFGFLAAVCEIWHWPLPN